MGERAGTLDIGDLGKDSGLLEYPVRRYSATEQPGDYLRQLNVLSKLISGETLRIEDKNVRGEDNAGVQDPVGYERPSRDA